MKAKKKQRTKKLIILSAVLVILVIIILTFLFKDKKSENNYLDEIKEYGYYLEDSKTNYYQSLFTELKNTLDTESVDEEAYARLISQMFVADFFDLNSKISKNDVGGTMFVYTDYQSSFEALAKEGIYHYVKNNFDNNRKQNLPKVEEVKITDLETREYDYLDETDENAYFVEAEITYKEDLEYQREVSLVLVHVNNKLEIVKMS